MVLLYAVQTLLVEVWYPMTVATNSYYQKVLLYDALRRTSDSMDALKVQLHDFGYRGSTSVEVSMFASTYLFACTVFLLMLVSDLASVNIFR